MGKPTATDAEIEEALRRTNAWDFVSEFPDKLDHFVGAGGSQLSGGQKQRIALARAFVKKPRLLIFDEATSALDKRNEAEVQASIDQMKAGLAKEGHEVTSIVIAHRLSTVANADWILVLKKGRLVEEGTPSELKNKPGGHYAKLVRIQEQGEQEEQEDRDVAAAGAVTPGNVPKINVDLTQGL